MHAQNAITTRHAPSNSQHRTPAAPDRRGDSRARPLPPRKPGRTHDPLRLSQVPMPPRPQPAPRPLPILDPESRSQDLHPDAQPRTARAVPAPVRQHQAPSRAHQRTRDALSRNRRASRRMDKNVRQSAPATSATAETPLQITCPRRSPGPAAVTAKTPRNGLEITAALRALQPGPSVTLCNER